MYRSILSLIISFGFCIVSPAQTSNKTLFIIDSIPLINDPEEWNPILQEDIADLHILQKDSLVLFGWDKFDNVIYVFTKEYRNRPDSIKIIPSLKQMILRNGDWHFHNDLYTGKYIDYYNNGKILGEGNLLNGKSEGELIVYFKNGNKKSIGYYKDGVLHGKLKEYYKNSALMQEREYVNGKQKGIAKTYFINGQIEYELRSKKESRYDTSITYYSTGKIKKMKIIKPGELGPSKEEQDLGYYNTNFYQAINETDIKKANKNFYQIWLRDSASSDTYFREGLLMETEFRFDEAIASYNHALESEPLMRETLAHRALARIKKYKYPHAKTMAKNVKQLPLGIEDIMLVPYEEQLKICNDLRLAEYVDYSEFFVMKMIPKVILNYCRELSNNK